MNSLTLFFAEKPLKCFSCKNAKSNEECNMQPMETCKGHNQVTKIANETDKSNYLTYSKKWETILNGIELKWMC